MRKFNIIASITALLLVLTAAIAVDIGSNAAAQPCSINIPLCGNRVPYTAGSGISIDSNNVISNSNVSGTQSAHAVFSGPASGSPALPTFRTIVAGDLPAAITPTTVNGNTVTTGTGTLTLGSATLNAGPGGTLGAVAFNAAVGITETCSVTPTGITIVGGIITAVTGGTCTP